MLSDLYQRWKDMPVNVNLDELVEIRRDLANSLGIWVSAKLKSV